MYIHIVPLDKGRMKDSFDLWNVPILMVTLREDIWERCHLSNLG